MGTHFNYTLRLFLFSVKLRMRYCFFLLFVIFSSNSVNAQDTTSASVLKAPAYKLDPKLYLSKIDPAKISSKVLIDRTFYTDLILKNNGQNLVTNIDAGGWSRIYTWVWKSCYDTTFFTRIDTLRKVANYFYTYENTHIISILDITFDRVSQNALTNGELVENSDFLIDVKATSSSFTKNRAIASSSMDLNIYGDSILFMVPDLFYLSNNANQKLQKLEIDFGDGSGFRVVNFNEKILIQYNPSSGYVELKTKLTFENYYTGEIETLFSLCSFFRTGSSTVPKASAIPEQFNKTDGTGRPSRSLPTNLLYYPEGTTVTTTSVYYTNSCEVKFGWNGFYTACEKVPHYVTTSYLSGRELEYCFLFSPNNLSGKLRRPFVIVDGFDPGNHRNYYTTNYDKPDELLPRDCDFRGLFQLLNGDPSPWYPGSTDVNMITELRNNGFDIVIVNFLDGAGDIPKNANSLRGFFNNVINSPAYRDNKTEEIVLVGPSMGGIITRHMLTTMEKEGENHFVKQWLSFDSPQKGAYIPIALQHAIKFMTKIHDGGLDALKEGRNGFIAGVNTLNTPAAQQMLLYHYTQTSGTLAPTPAFINLYNQLNSLGYPKYSKNYSLTNGGTQKLYDYDGVQILDFMIFPWTWVIGYEASNARNSSSYRLFTGSRQGFNNDEEISTSGEISYENAPGGWHSALYSINCNDNNWNKANDNDAFITHLKATFIPTASALGITPTKDNISLTWDQYTNCNDNSSGKIRTPFDEIKGMIGKNEEHVRISPTTKTYLIEKVLQSDLTNSQRPRSREGQIISQRIKGKVAYLEKQTLKFAGNNNQIIFEEGTDANAKAGELIHFLPGFQIKQGAKFSAVVGSVDYGTTLRTNRISTSHAKYYEPSPYKGKTYDYSNKNTAKLISLNFKVSVTPNPVNTKLILNLSDLGNEDAEVKIMNTYGIEIKRLNVKEGVTEIDVSMLESGIYFISTSSNNQFIVNKFLKID